MIINYVISSLTIRSVMAFHHSVSDSESQVATEPPASRNECLSWEAKVATVAPWETGRDMSTAGRFTDAICRCSRGYAWDITMIITGEKIISYKHSYIWLHSLAMHIQIPSGASPYCCFSVGSWKHFFEDELGQHHGLTHHFDSQECQNKNMQLGFLLTWHGRKRKLLGPRCPRGQETFQLRADGTGAPPS